MGKVDWDIFKWGKTLGYVLMAVLLLVYAGMSNIEMDMTGIGFGHIDPFFTLFMFWIMTVFITEGIVPKLQRRSIRGMSEEWRGPLTDEKPSKRIPQQRYGKEVVANELAIVPTGGTSKPCVEGFAGVRHLVYPEDYSVIIGGTVVIMAKLHTHRRGEHGDILPHILDGLQKMKRFVKDQTRVAIGEEIDSKWAVYEDGEWIIKDVVTKKSSKVIEASVCRKINDLKEEGYRLRTKLEKYGQIPDEEEE